MLIFAYVYHHYHSHSRIFAAAAGRDAAIAAISPSAIYIRFPAHFHAPGFVIEVVDCSRGVVSHARRPHAR